MIYVALIGQSDRQVEIGTYLANQDTIVKVTRVIEPNLEEAKRLAQRFGANPSDNLDDVLKDSIINLVCVDVPYEDRVRTIEQCAENGKDILCMGPVASDLEDTQRILDSVRKNQVRLFSPYPHRNNPHLKMAKEMILKEGRELVSIHFSIKQKEKQGGAIVNPGATGIDFTRWFTGFDICQIYCRIVKSNECEKGVALFGRLENGTFLSMDAVHSYFDEIVCEALYNDALLLLTPTNQSVHVDFVDSKMAGEPNMESLRFSIDEVVRTIENDSNQTVSYEDIRSVAYLMDQSRLSAKQSKSIKTALNP